jgi:hypothetical protein
MTIDITRPCPPANALSPRALGEHESDELWALTRTQRQQAMWNGALTLFQLREWTGRAPTEIPTLGREFAWIVMRTPEWDEIAETVVAQHRDDHADNVVAFPDREEHREAA